MSPENGPKLHRDRLAFLLSTLEDMGETLTGGETFDTAARYLLRMLLGSIGISSGAIFTFASKRKVLRLKDKTSGHECDIKELKISDDMIARMADNARPHRASNLPEWLSEGLGQMAEFWKQHKVQVVIPLAVKGDLLGMVCLGTRFMNQSYTEIDLQILSLLTRHISLYFHSQKSLEQARQANYELRRKVLEMEQLYEVGLAITGLKSPDDVLDEIVTRATTILDSRYGAVWLKKDGKYYLAGVFGFKNELPVPEIMADLTGRSASSIRFGPDDSHCLMAPMTIRNTPMGVLSVAGKESRMGGYMAFSETDFQLLASFANQAAVAMENARLYVEALEKERLDQELKVAAEIQEAILPESFPEHPKLDISALTLQSRTVGGDFFDFFNMADGTPAMVIADISGKGIPAAMLVSTFHGALHAYAGYLDSLEELAGRLNKLLVNTTPENKFVTAAFLTWNPDTGDMITLSAGHEPMILVRTNGAMEQISEGGMVLGLFADIEFTGRTVRLNPGDSLCLYTDGITDRTNAEGEQFGFDRFEMLLKETVGGDASGIVRNVFQKLETFAGDEPAPDDQTMLVLVRKPE
jgi:phosphoserine phosphatase RsbU/P